MSDEGSERRGTGRARLELPVEYERLNAFLSDYTHNLSRGGTFIRTEQPLEVGTQLAFRIKAPELGELVLQGVVRWVVTLEDADDERPAGMGIAFLHDSAAEQYEVELRLDRVMVQALGPEVYEKLMKRPAPSDF
ncbi:MAG: TIGR02266 family protein [Polyangiales bacterium]